MKETVYRLIHYVVSVYFFLCQQSTVKPQSTARHLRLKALAFASISISSSSLS